jgi:hypothetical protein
MSPSETRLEYQVFTARRPGLSRDVPPGYESLMWVANSATLIAGKRDAVLVDTFLTIDQGVKLADEIAATGKNLTYTYITHGMTARPRPRTRRVARGARERPAERPLRRVPSNGRPRAMAAAAGCRAAARGAPPRVAT